MFRTLAAATVAAGFVLSTAPAHAKPEPIRGFTVTVKDEQIRATALVPGSIGRKAQLQQFADGRWVTVASTRTKRTKTTPRARWRVDVADLRLPSAQSRAQAGPLAELARLRAQAGKSTSKPKKVKVTVPNPLMPRVVSGFVGSQMVMPPFESLWSGQVRFEAVETQDGAYTVRYRLASASLAWSVESQQPGCLIKGEGTFSEADLKGEGWIDVSPMKGGKTGYRFTITRETPVTLDVTCGSQKTQYETDQELFILNTLDCPSGGTVGSTYTGQPWTNRKPPFVFFGKLGLNAASFCSSTLTPPGSFQSWELTGSELFEFADGLAPIAK